MLEWRTSCVAKNTYYVVIFSSSVAIRLRFFQKAGVQRYMECWNVFYFFVNVKSVYFWKYISFLILDFLQHSI